MKPRYRYGSQRQTIFEYLLSQEEPQDTREIAENTGFTNKAVQDTLNGMRNKGDVSSIQTTGQLQTWYANKTRLETPQKAPLRNELGIENQKKSLNKKKKYRSISTIEADIAKLETEKQRTLEYISKQRAKLESLMA